MTRPDNRNKNKGKNLLNRAGPTMAFVVVALQTTSESYTFCTSSSLRNSSWRLARLRFGDLLPDLNLES